METQNTEKPSWKRYPDIDGSILSPDGKKTEIGTIALWEQDNSDPNRPVFCGNIKIDGIKYPVKLWQEPNPELAKEIRKAERDGIKLDRNGESQA